VTSEENKQDRLLGAVRNMAELPDKDKVNIKGKLYAEVHTRVQAFREAFGSDGKIISKQSYQFSKMVAGNKLLMILLKNLGLPAW